MRAKFLVFWIGIFGLISACVFPVNIAIGIPNLGWENGTIFEWESTAGAGVNVATVCRTTMLPEAGTYALCFYTPSAGGVTMEVEYTLTDTVILSQIAGRDVTWNIEYQDKLEFSGGGGDIRRMELSDNVGTDTTVFTTPHSPGAYTTASVTRTITASPTELKLLLHWSKTGAGTTYALSVDSMTVPDVILNYDFNAQWPDLFVTFTIFGVMILGVGFLFAVVVLQIRLKIPFFITIALAIAVVMLLVTQGVIAPAFILVGVVLAGVIAFFMLIRGRSNE